MQLDDSTFLRRFASRDLGQEHFDHRGHLRMAWLHLVHFGLDEANRRVCEGIRDLAIKFEAPEKYSHTLTEALMRIMSARLTDETCGDFERFLKSNRDLVDDAEGVLARHYSRQRLTSAEARAGWLEPDLMPIHCPNQSKETTMNTQQSDKIVQQWQTTPNPLKRGAIRYGRDFNTTPLELFPLLCPTTEYDWLPGWNCELLHSESGYTEYNVVFKTRFFGAEELWVCTRFEPGRAIEYARTAENYCAKMDIHLADNGDGTTTGTWMLTVSALKEQGNQAVAALESAPSEMMQILGTLAHYVEHGEMQR
jgi:hypothetical protein